MWEHCYKWDTRNKARHGKDDDSKAKLRLEKAHRSIRALFLHAQRRSFYPTVVEHFHIETDNQNRETWLETYEPMIMQNAKHRESTLDGRLHQIDEVFTSTHNVTRDNLTIGQTSTDNTPHHCHSPKGSISNTTTLP
ncbi:hypothetical protein IV203_020326 [Nitzschia inconspicua]|uniref:Uncharacterized protein n=1 Tax=Nitzschia inconspicua TaxID=303405 RepID=A0A9K3K6X4_9STRA|nr:hypothetical protein IV203_020326 [Nitzschia inconspicua]